MKAPLLVLAVSCFVFTFTSCQKEITDEISRPADTTITNTSKYLVKTYTEDYTSSSGHIAVTFNLSYDASDRILTLVDAASAGDRFVYKYASNTRYSLDIYNSNAVSIHGEFLINSIGYIDSSIQYNDTQDTSTQKFFYDANKLLVQSKEYEIINGQPDLINTTNYTYDANRNIIKEKDNSSETTYEYTTLPDNLNVGLVYGPRNKYLPKTTTVTGPNAATATHTYTFDSLNRLSSEKAVTSRGEIGIKTYTY